ncbi:hypothetical protein SAMN05661080_03263 [Modestobacter sp. DSM 44400]|nr:hypothetical protein SAMN05661080_03263 [Modestobacter sp. DSM 44400]
MDTTSEPCSAAQAATAPTVFEGTATPAEPVWPCRLTTTESAGTTSSSPGEPSIVSASGRSSSSAAAVSQASVERTRSARRCSSSSTRSTSRRDRVEPRNSAAARVACGGACGPE